VVMRHRTTMLWRTADAGRGRRADDHTMTPG
jgi:hypothetical protein